MQLRKTDERQVYGVEGRGRGKGQNETSRDIDEADETQNSDKN